jgi:hypothetical protein
MRPKSNARADSSQLISAVSRNNRTEKLSQWMMSGFMIQRRRPDRGKESSAGGGYLSSLIFGWDVQSFSIARLAVAVAGALLLLFLYHFLWAQGGGSSDTETIVSTSTIIQRRPTPIGASKP